MIFKIRNIVTDTRLSNIDYNSEDLLDIHREILDEKKMLRKVFAKFYDKCIESDNKFLTGEGIRIEIGAGTSFFKSKYPEILSSDIKHSKNLDMVVDAMNMPFDDNSVRTVYGINCFHHFPYPEKFFSELSRCLCKGGGCILIEPYYGMAASYIYKNIFTTETFNKNQQYWDNSKNTVMTGANQALSYIVFVRDHKKFETKFPALEIVHQEPLNNYMEYLLSGGLNFKQLCPTFLLPFIHFVEFLLQPFIKLFALHYLIVIRKK